jgi:hypothetical protein
MELDERGRQLGEVSRQLCDVGSVGRASAARLYAAGNAATAGKETRVEKVRRPSAGRIADRGPPPGSPAADCSQPIEIGRSSEAACPAEILRTVFRGNCEARLETRRSRRHSRYAQHLGKIGTTGSKSATGRQRSTSAAPRGRERGADLDRQHHGPATLPE